MKLLLGVSLVVGVFTYTGQVMADCLNPASFGAVPNDGVGDSAAIQQVLDAIPLGGVVCLGSGTFDIGTPLTFGLKHSTSMTLSAKSAM